jgi:hypothetical protein
MSSLLDQAIIDANALKEAALKNAERKVLDMYSGEVKKAVDTLLEQDKKEEKNPLMPERNGLMTSPDLEIAVSKAIKPPEAPAQPFGVLRDAYKTDDSDKVSISFTALEEALDLDEAWVGEDKIIPPSKAKKERTEEESVEDEQFDHTASNYGEMEEMSGSDMLGSEQGAGYVGGSDYIEEGEEQSLEEMEMEEMYSIGAYPGNQNPDSDSSIMYELEEELMDEYGGEQEPDMMKEYELEEELYGEGDNLKDIDEEQDSLYGADREDLDEVLVLDMEPSLQGHLGFNPVHYKEQVMIMKALEAHEAETDKLKKKEKKLQEDLRQAKKSLTEMTEAYSDLKKEHKQLVTESLKSHEIIKVYERQNKKLTESLNMMVISNTKLLYTSKVLGDDSLNERQKKSLVENISKADTVDRVKVIYETLQSGVGTEERKSPKSLSEAITRKNS